MNQWINHHSQHPFASVPAQAHQQAYLFQAEVECSPFYYAKAISELKR